MSTFRLLRVQLENFRCFETLDVAFDPEVTVFFAENGGGKTAILTSLAMALALLQPRTPKELKIDVERDARKVRHDERREPAGDCSVRCGAVIGANTVVTWGITASPFSSRRVTSLQEANGAVDAVRRPGEPWPLIAHYGTARLARASKAGPKNRQFQDRWDGYAGSLDPMATDGPLLDWLKAEALGDLVRHRKGEVERRFDLGVFQAMQRATPGLREIFYDPALESPVARFESGTEATWNELSDGYHVFLGLVGDIARRAAILNGKEGVDAPLTIEGVVLIDEIDLHLHPRWQRDVLGGLRAAFPKLQLVVTTHSPQVLSSVKNQQVRLLQGGRIETRDVHVEGRDSNSILRDLMGTEERDDLGMTALREIGECLAREDVAGAREKLAVLRQRWGGADPEVIRLSDQVDEASGPERG